MTSIRYYFLTILLIVLSLNACGTLNPYQNGTKPVAHQQFTLLLNQYVDDKGLVNYAGFLQDREALGEYLKLLSSHVPNDTWPEKEQLAYWINLYNAYTIELILSHYPVKSIKDIGAQLQVPFVNSPWDIKFIELAGTRYDLNNIEHNILRKKWEEPRIHFAINCASISCPKLRREAYEAETLEEQLEDQAKAFINDGVRNVVSHDEANLSRIFDWFGGDFAKNGELIEFINQYAKEKVSSGARITYREYDWSLNEQ